MDALGINVFSLLIYTILFAIIYLGLEKFVLPGLRKNIAARKQLISRNLQRADELKQEATSQQEELKQREKKLLKELQKERQKLLETTESEAAEIINKAKAKAQNILNDSKAAIAQKEANLEAEFEQKLNARLVSVFKYLNEKQGIKVDLPEITAALKATKNN